MVTIKGSIAINSNISPMAWMIILLNSGSSLNHNHQVLCSILRCILYTVYDTDINKSGLPFSSDHMLAIGGPRRVAHGRREKSHERGIILHPMPFCFFFVFKWNFTSNIIKEEFKASSCWHVLFIEGVLNFYENKEDGEGKRRVLRKVCISYFHEKMISFLLWLQPLDCISYIFYVKGIGREKEGSSKKVHIVFFAWKND